METLEDLDWAIWLAHEAPSSPDAAVPRLLAQIAQALGAKQAIDVLAPEAITGTTAFLFAQQRGAARKERKRARFAAIMRQRNNGDEH